MKKNKAQRIARRKNRKAKPRYFSRKFLRDIAISLFPSIEDIQAIEDQRIVSTLVNAFGGRHAEDN